MPTQLAMKLLMCYYCSQCV